jgi:hypothetical protein
VAGVPVNAVSAGALVAGAGLMTMGAGQLASHAAGDDHVTPMNTSGSSGPPPKMDMSKANYAQKTARREFSAAGDFSGMTIDDVADLLRAGKMKPDEVPINVVRRDGKLLILNTRSSLALEEAGVPRSSWKAVDRTGDPNYERRLTNQLQNNGLDISGTDSVRITGRKAR